MKLFINIFLSLLFILALSSCRKNSILEDPSAELQFSEDTVIFDTVFTTIGSVTKTLKVYNPYSENLIISEIKMGRGDDSQYRINVDGIPGPAKDIKVPPEDSLYIFVEVTVNPNNGTSPLIHTDSLLFFTNGNVQDVDLVAWGRDAIYYTPDYYQPGLPPYSIITCNDIWTADKPIVVYGYAVVDSTCQLTIQAGTNIHFHRNSGLWIYRGGSIKVNGTVGNPVVFQGDRLDHEYRNIPGQWDRIWINDGSVDNEFNHAIIKNSFIGIQAEVFPFDLTTPVTSNKVILKNTSIQNCSGMGLFARGSRIEAENLLIGNCGQYSFAVSGGGFYHFTHSTFGNYWSESSRETPAVYLQNYYEDFNGNIQVRDIAQADFKNCIIHGNIKNEFDTEKKSPGVINFLFDHAIIRTEKDLSNSSNYLNIVKNPSDSLFIDPGMEEQDFHLAPSSPAIDQGDVSYGNAVPTDLEGNDRTTDGAPDLGVYEKID